MLTSLTSRPKILLINPPVLTVLEPWFDSPEFVRTSLATLAGYLREHSDWEIKCFDAKYEKKSFEAALADIIAFAPDVVGFTAFTNEIKPAAYLAGLVKRHKPEIITICGGPHLTSIPEETLKEFPTFDIGVVGEGEETLLELCRSIKNNSSLHAVKGLVFRNEDNTIIKTPPRDRILNLESLPLPAWDLLPAAREYYIQTVRGCPFACEFCLNHNGRVARKRSPEQVIQEIEWLINEFKPARISFGDELFSVDMNRTDELMDLMIRHQIGDRVSWDIQTHVAFVNDGLLRKMKAAKLEKIEMGVESGDADILKKMGKGTNIDMIRKAFRTAKKYGIKTGTFFIIGQPYETHRTIWESIKLAIKINPTEPIFGTMVPYPGTEVARMAAHGEGKYKLLTTNWDEYRKQLNGSMEITGISRRTLEWYQLFAYTIVFLANLRVLDFMSFFWNYRQGAVNLLKKVLVGNKETSDPMQLPADYEDTINSSYQVSMSDISESRSNWKSVQADELKRAKSLSPELIREQLPHAS